MTRRKAGDGEPKDTRGPGWVKDAAGRPHRIEKGTTIYQTADDRDAATDETYRLSPVARLVLEIEGEPTKMVERVCVAAPELADLFWRELEMLPPGTMHDKLLAWQVHHFGRALEPAAVGVLLFEVRHLDAGKKDRGSASQFASVAEQRRFEKHAAETSHIADPLERLEEICRRAGAPVGGAKTMPAAEPRLPYKDA